MVAADCMGPYPKSEGGHAYTIVFRDLFSKWAECVPLRKANAKTIRRALEDTVVYRWDTPEVLFTDNGTKFKNKEMAKAAADLGIRHPTTPPYHFQANPVERSNRMMKTMIASFTQENHKNWDKHLSEFRFAMNTDVHSSLKTSPAFSNSGREPRPPQTIKRREEGQPEIIELHLLSSAASFVSSKLGPKYKGPYTVIRVLSKVVYEVTDSEGRVDKVHVKDLKPYYEQGFPNVGVLSDDYRSDAEEGAQLSPRNGGGSPSPRRTTRPKPTASPTGKVMGSRQGRSLDSEGDPAPTNTPHRRRRGRAPKFHFPGDGKASTKVVVRP